MQHQLVVLCIGDSDGGNEVLCKIQMEFSLCEGRCGVGTGGEVSVLELRLVCLYTACLRQQCHNTTVSQLNSVTTQQCHNTTVSQHNSVTTPQCHNSKCVTFFRRKV